MQDLNMQKTILLKEIILPTNVSFGLKDLAKKSFGSFQRF
jgi:hypothetical protein